MDRREPRLRDARLGLLLVLGAVFAVGWLLGPLVTGLLDEAVEACLRALEKAPPHQEAPAVEQLMHMLVERGAIEPAPGNQRMPRRRDEVLKVRIDGEPRDPARFLAARGPGLLGMADLLAAAPGKKGTGG